MKKKIILILLVLISFFAAKNVYAEEMGACTVTDLAKLRQSASNIKVSYIAQIAEEEGIKKRYFEIKIFNLPSTVFGTISVGGKWVSGNAYEFDYTQKKADGAVTYRQDAVSAIVEYEIKIFSNKDNCYGDLLRSFKITIPKFNQYSELRACEDIPEYYMCQEYITFDIDGSKFYDAVDAYKQKLAEESTIPALETVYYANDPISGISHYKYIIVGIIVGIGIFLTVRIILKKKKEVK